MYGGEPCHIYYTAGHEAASSDVRYTKPNCCHTTIFRKPYSWAINSTGVSYPRQSVIMRDETLADLLGRCIAPDIDDGQVLSVILTIPDLAASQPRPALPARCAQPAVSQQQRMAAPGRHDQRTLPGQHTEPGAGGAAVALRDDPETGIPVFITTSPRRCS